MSAESIESLAHQGWMRRCIILTPSAEYEAWLAALHEGAVASDLEVVLHHGVEDFQLEDDDRRIFVSTQKKFLRPAPDGYICVIATGVKGAVRKTAEITGAAGHYAMMDAAQFLVDSLTYQSSLLITDDVVDRAQERRVEVLPGVIVQAPQPMSMAVGDAFDRASADAFGIFASGLPPVGSTASWPPELYFYATRREPQRERIAAIDLTGGPGLLVHGPQIALPAGEWELTASFTVDESASKYKFLFEWGSSEDFVSFSSAPAQSGQFQVVMTHIIGQPFRASIRIVLTEGALDGTFEFLGAVLRRTG
ncbi:hypothetical protein BH10PSE2_BH10PSE2_07590 [soil metagenome]